MYNQETLKKPIFTALSPNAQADDIFIAMRLMFMPWRWKRGKFSALLRDTLKEYLGLKNVFLFESGRTCLYAILKSLDLKPDDEVLFQGFTCVAVPDPILWAGAKPVYVDCEEDSLNMSPADLENKIAPRSRVLIIQHTFGLPAEIDKLMEIAKRHKLFVIEDCAHALGSEYKGQKTGTFGDASFFSFGRDKVISSVFGGALATNDRHVAEKIAVFHSHCRDADAKWIFRQLLHPVLIGIVKLTYRIIVGKVILVLAKRLGLISLAVYKEEKRGGRPPFVFRKMPDALAELALNQFRKLEKFNLHRRALADQYDEGLRGLPLSPPPRPHNSLSTYLRYTVRSGKAAEILKKAKEEDINLGDWYCSVLAPEGVDMEKLQYGGGTCPNAENAARVAFNLPTGVQISPKDARRIIDFLKRFYAAENK